MAQWSGKKVNASEINNGNEYERKDRPTRQQLNAIVNNSLFASNVAENVASQLAGLGENDKVEFKGSTPNLLINGDFRVNQRGQANYNVNSLFTVDAWKLVYGSLAINSDGSVTHTSTNTWQGIRQYITNPSRLAGKIVTFSMRANSTSTRLAQINLTKSGATSSTILGTSNTIQTGEAITSFTATIPSDVTDNDSLFILLYTPQANQSVTYYWAKLEIGSIATAYSPKPYEQELADCQVIEGGFATTYSNPNLLINGDFRVNQRGRTSYSGYVYGVDRWIGNTGSVVEPQANGGVKITRTANGNGMLQRVEDWANLAGKTVTFSAKITNIIGSMRITIYTGATSFRSNIISSDGIVSITTELPTDIDRLECFINPIEAGEFIVEWAKLELGSVATPFVPRPYAEELALCRRFYQRTSHKTGESVEALIGIFVAANTTAGFALIELLVPMRNTPSISYNNIKIGYSSATFSSTSIASFIYNSIDAEYQKYKAYITGTGFTAGQTYYIAVGTGGYIEFDAEIY